MSNNKMNLIGKELYRKSVHILLTIILLLPYLIHLPWPLTLNNYYATGLFLAAFINSLVARRGKVLGELKKFRENIEGIIEKTNKELKQPLFLVEQAVSKLQEIVSTQISMLERDYEKREGYVGLLYGMIGATLSILVSPETTVYGLLALATVDTVSALHDLFFNNGQRTLRGSFLALIVYFFILVLVGSPLLSSFLLSIIACITEYISPEDNLTVPFVTTLAALFVGMPLKSPL